MNWCPMDKKQTLMEVHATLMFYKDLIGMKMKEIEHLDSEITHLESEIKKLRTKVDTLS